MLQWSSWTPGLSSPWFALKVVNSPVCTSQDQESGDGTNLCVSFGGELLLRAEELLKAAGLSLGRGWARSMMETKGKMSHWHQPKSQGWVTRWNKEEDPEIGRQLSGPGIGPKSVRRSLDWKSEEGIHANDVYKAGRCWQGAARCREDRAPIVGHLRHWHSQQPWGNPWDQQDLRKRMQHLFADLQWVHPTKQDGLNLKVRCVQHVKLYVYDIHSVYIYI